MRIFNKDKTKEIQTNEVNTLTEKLVDDKLFICHHEEVKECPKQSHFEVVKTFPNGGKDVREVIDVEYVQPQAAYDEYEDILRVGDMTEEEILANLRNLRQRECFSIVNRGMVWYAQIDSNKNLQLERWYKEWLDITDTYSQGKDVQSIIPKKPEWLK